MRAADAFADDNCIRVEQMVHDIVNKDSNVFLFGVCGTGKSQLVKDRLIPELKKVYGEKGVLVTEALGLPAWPLMDAQCTACAAWGVVRGRLRTFSANRVARLGGGWRIASVC